MYLIAMRRRGEDVKCNENRRECKTMYNYNTVLDGNKSQNKRVKWPDRPKMH
jgi:hypothetical protein